MKYKGLEINRIAFGQHIHLGDPLEQLMRDKHRGIDKQMTHLIAMQQFKSVKGHFKLRIYHNRAMLLYNGETIDLTHANSKHCDELVERVKKFRFELPSPSFIKPPGHPQLPEQQTPPPFGQDQLKKTGRLGEDIGSAYTPPSNSLPKTIADAKKGLAPVTQNAFMTNNQSPTNPQEDLRKTANGARLAQSIVSSSSSTQSSHNDEIQKTLENLRTQSHQNAPTTESGKAADEKPKSESSKARVILQAAQNDEVQPKPAAAKALKHTQLTDFELEKKMRATRFEINRLLKKASLTPLYTAISRLTQQPSYNAIEAGAIRDKIKNLKTELKDLKSEKQTRIEKRKPAKQPKTGVNPSLTSFSMFDRKFPDRFNNSNQLNESNVQIPKRLTPLSHFFKQAAQSRKKPANLKTIGRALNLFRKIPKII